MQFSRAAPLQRLCPQSPAISLKHTSLGHREKWGSANLVPYAPSARSLVALCQPASACRGAVQDWLVKYPADWPYCMQACGKA